MKVTIVIPVYNGANYLESCIQSCLNQSYKKIEILLINDGSTDSSEDIITKYETGDNRVRHITQVNQGLVRSRKNGAKYANTEFIVFLDADDTLTPDAIQKLVNKQENADADIVFSNFIVEFESGKKLSCSNNNFENICEPMCVLNNIYEKKIAPTIWGKLIRKELYANIDVPDDITIGEDAIAITQLLLLKPKIASIDDNIYHYIQRRNSMVNTVSSAKNSKRLYLIQYLKDYITNRFSEENTITDSLKGFLMIEYFDVLRDGGTFEDIKKYYNWSTSLKPLIEYKKILGWPRILMLYSFGKCQSIGKIYRTFFNTIRKLKYQI